MHHLLFCKYFLRIIILLLMASKVFAQTHTGSFLVPQYNSFLHMTSTGEEVPAMGPTDFTIIDDEFAVLDSLQSSIVFLKQNGVFLKRIQLSQGYYERLVRLRDKTFLAFAQLDVHETKMVHLNREGIIEERIIHAPLSNFATHLLVDDLGLFMEIHGELPDLKHLNLASNQSLILKKSKDLFQQKQLLRIMQECLTCSPVSAQGALVNGAIYNIKFAKAYGREPSLFIGERQIALDLLHPHGHTRLEQIDIDGTAWVNESIFINDYPESYLWKINSSGEILAVYHEPHIDADDFVNHSLAISDTGRVYWMGANKKGLMFQTVNPLSLQEQKRLLKTLKTPTENQDMDFTQHKERNPLSAVPACIPRLDMYIESLRYLYAYICLSSAAIEEDESCKGRKIPPYLKELEEGQCTFAISYNWGGFDSIDSFIEKIDQMKAGNVNTSRAPLLHCAAGVDCSGFISRLWQLPVKWNTNAIYQNTQEISAELMQQGDVFVKPGNHVMMFVTWYNDEIITVESTVIPGKVISSTHDLGWFKARNYSPRLAVNACPESSRG
jgi:hypothetical protein